MNTNALYDLWLTHAKEDSSLIEELESIRGNEEEIYDRFYRELEFGTAGLRGTIGAGTNRMNIYVVRLATQGLANYLNKKYDKTSVVICRDSRIKSDLFAIEAARVLAGNGITVHFAKEIQPTPVTSFAIRELKCQAGIMVTASHNPAKYNGYKCYGSDGCQMTDESADDVYAEIGALDYFTDDIKLIDFEKGLEQGSILYLEDTVLDSYIANVKRQAINPGICKGSDLKVVYTPLNGAGNKMVRRILAETDVENVIIVKEQEEPDGNFTTCPYPNPEEKEALQLGLDLCEKVKPDLLLATDPDSDRVGIAVKDDDGSYRLITGNETGIMLTDYILSCRKEQNSLPKNPIVVKTIVTTNLIKRICKKYNCQLKNVLTGFKYIGEQILELEEKGEEDRYVFGFEESYGYLAGTYVRDKDAVVASMLICEMAAYYKKQGKSLSNVIDNLYDEYGYYKNKTVSFEFDGAAGMEKMNQIMCALRQDIPRTIVERKVVEVDDYLDGTCCDLVSCTTEAICLPKSNVICFSLEDGSSITVRPSGTEPKIKLYITAVGKNKTDAEELIAELLAAGQKLLGV